MLTENFVWKQRDDSNNIKIVALNLHRGENIIFK